MDYKTLMSKFYNEESKYPDIGQNNNNENPYVSSSIFYSYSDKPAPAGNFYSEQKGGNQMMQSVFLKDTE